MSGASSKQKLDAHPVQEGGALGWFAVLGAFGSTFALVGILKTLAVMLPTLQDQFNAPTWLVGWMIAIVEGVSDITGPLTAPLVKYFGVRTVVMGSGMLLGVSVIVSSFTANLGVMTIVLAGFAAPVTGFSYIATRGLIGHCFDKSYQRAYGIAFLGNSSGHLIWAPLVQFFLDQYGWRGTLMLTGALLSNLAVCGALLRSPTETRGRTVRSTHTGYEPIALEREEKRPENCKSDTSRSVWASVSDAFDLDLFASPTYWLLAFIAIVLTAMDTAWNIYFPGHTNQSKGYSLADVATFISVYGAGNVVGNFVVGFFANSKVLMGVSVAVASVLLLIDPLLTSYWSIMAYVAVYGCCNCILYVLQDVITKAAIGVDRLGSAFGWMALKYGFCRLLLLFFPGLIYDTFGSYTLAFILMGSVNALALPALLVLAWMQRKNCYADD